MILNSYTILDAFTTFLRLVTAALVIGLALPAWRRWTVSAPPEREKQLEDRFFLLFLLTLLLVFLNVASWPLLYLLLQSYVPECPGAMCIYGVTQIGAGSLGPSRFLPGLLTALQLLKPGLVFLAGAWLVLYLVNRRTATASLMPRVLLVGILLGVIALVDAGIEGAYLLLPRDVDAPSVGCCTLVFDTGSFSMSPFGHDESTALTWMYFGVNIAMAWALATAMRRERWRRFRLLDPLALGAIVSLVVNVGFLIEVAAPALLHLPDHHCPYDLIPQVPEVMVAVASFVFGSFAVGWAWLAAHCWLGRSAESRLFLDPMIRTLLRLALIAFVASLAMISVELYLALP